MARAIAERTTATYGIATGAFVAERDTWPEAIARGREEGWRWLELTAMGERLAGLLALLESEPAALDGFDRVSIHAPAKSNVAPAEVVAALEPLPFDVVLHPDVFGREPSCARLGPRAVFENMDVTKRFGCDVDDLGEVFDRFPAAGFCLDVAHVWTNDRTLRLGHDLVDVFGGRLRQLHVSGIEPDGTHRPTTVADVAMYEPLLERCPHVPWLLEAELVEDAA
jgi:hypothetical protein